MHSRNTVRYYLIVVALLLFLFFTNDFGLTDVQKTAIVMGVGIDREDETFIVTAQIAVPSSRQQTQPVQIESRGSTVAEAFSSINRKSGWYPKLVFCKLIVLGEETTKKNVFDALDFFLRDEYMSDNCLVVACEGSAKDIFNAETPIDSISSVAMQKVLSDHAARVGTVAPNTLRDFSKGYFGAARCGWLPVLRQEEQQESLSNDDGSGGSDEKAEQSPENSGDSGGSENSQSSQSSGSSEEKSGTSDSRAKVFSAAETALFKDGVMTGKLDERETFAFCTVAEKLRLASYPLSGGSEGTARSLIVKHNRSDVKLSIDKNAVARLKISVVMTVGIEDSAAAEPLKQIASPGNLSAEIFAEAEETLKSQIRDVFEKSRASGCDLFRATEKLQRFQSKYFSAYRDDLLDRVQLDVNVTFKSVR